MNVTQLRAFISVVDLGSFSEAARQTGVSQPAVTMQIKALENDLGATLLDRRYHGIELTDAGRALLPYARTVLQEVTRARDDIQALSGTLTGRLTIAASTTPGDYLIPRLLAGFLQANPQVQVEIAVQDTAESVAAVEAGRADIGVCGAPSSSLRVTFEELDRDEIVLICAPGSLFAARANVPYADLAEADWVAREPGSGTWKVARQALAQRGVDPDELRIIVELGSADAIVSAVEGDLGIAMVSRRAAEKAVQLGTVAIVDAEGEPILRPFYTVLPAAPSRVALAFAQHLRSAVAPADAASGTRRHG